MTQILCIVMIECAGLYQLCGVVGSVENGEYPRTLEYWGGPSSTCDDIRHQGLINALDQGDGCRLGQGVVRIGPGWGGWCPSLLTHRHLIHGVQRARRQKFTWEDNEVYTWGFIYLLIMQEQTNVISSSFCLTFKSWEVYYLKVRQIIREVSVEYAALKPDRNSNNNLCQTPPVSSDIGAIQTH